MQSLGSALQRAPPGGDLHQHTVEKRRDGRTGKCTARIEANAHAAGAAISDNATVVRLEIIERIFRSDAALNRETIDLHIFLAANVNRFVLQRITHRDEYLRAHEVNTGHFFGHRMLHLNARIHFDKKDIFFFVYQKLNRARVAVIHRPCQAQGVIVQFVFRRITQGQTRRNFHHFLKTALHRAVALVQVNDVAIFIAQNLHLDVLRLLDKLLQKHRVIAKSRTRLSPRLFVFALQVLLLAHDAHATTTTTGSRFDNDGKTDALGFPQRSFCVGQRLPAVFNQRHIQAFRQNFRRHFIAQALHGFCCRTDKNDTFLKAAAGKFYILRQKAVARVNGFHAIALGNAQNLFDVKIGFQRIIFFANLIGFVCLVAVQRITIFVGINSYRAQFQLRSSAQYADGNFAPIGDHDLVKAFDFSHFLLVTVFWR